VSRGRLGIGAKLWPGIWSIGNAVQRFGRLEIGRIEIVLARQADHGEEAIAARVCKRCAHELRMAQIGHSADRPQAADPLARSMRNRCRQKHERPLSIDMGRLDQRKLLFAEALAYDVEPR
jgi:hypothetical protein